MKRINESGPFWIDPETEILDFPDAALAMRDPPGLLAIGGDLSVDRLLSAYRNGIFPWFGPGQPILWWSPDPRLVLFPEQLRISRSLARTLRKALFTVTLDQDFAAVIAGCAAPRPGQSGTWITAEMRAAYLALHRQGYAHSVECWQHGELVGGLYGVAIGRVFFGESMFARVTDASKAGFVALVRELQQRGFGLIDCQVKTAHLLSLGAITIARSEFIERLRSGCAQPGYPGRWTLADGRI